MLEIAAVKEKAVAKQEQKDAVGGQQSLKKNLKAMFQRKGTILLKEDNENSELMTKLRAWKMAKKNLEREKLNQQLEECKPNMEDSEIKVMILKLMQTEKLLKQIFSKKKRDQKKKHHHKRHKHHHKGHTANVPRDEMSRSGSRKKHNRDNDDASVSNFGGQRKHSRAKDQSHMSVDGGLPDHVSD